MLKCSVYHVVNLQCNCRHIRVMRCSLQECYTQYRKPISAIKISLYGISRGRKKYLLELKNIKVNLRDELWQDPLIESTG